MPVTRCIHTSGAIASWQRGHSDPQRTLNPDRWALTQNGKDHNRRSMGKVLEHNARPRSTRYNASDECRNKTEHHNSISAHDACEQQGGRRSVSNQCQSTTELSICPPCCALSQVHRETRAVQYLLCEVMARTNAAHWTHRYTTGRNP